MNSNSMISGYEEAILNMETNPDKALELFSTAFDTAQRDKNEEYEAKILFQMGVTYHNKSDHTESLKFFNNALSLPYVETDKQLKAQLYRTIGVQYFRGFNFEQALNYFNKSLVLCEEIGFTENIHMLYGSFGAVYTKLKQYKLALDYSLKSLHLAEQSNDDIMKKFSLMYVGGDFFHLEENVKSRDYLTRSIQLDGSQFAHSNALYFLASLERREKHLETAARLAIEMIEICRKHNFMEFEALGLCLLGEIYSEQKNRTEASKCLTESKILADRINAFTIYFRAGDGLINLLEETENFKDAISEYRKLYEKRFEFLQKEETTKVRQLMIESELAQLRSEAEIERLRNVDLARALDEVSRLNHDLKRMNDDKNEFMSIAVHDLKNPLQNILSSARLMKASGNAERSEVLDFTEKIMNQTQRMFDLIKKLLDINAIEQGEIKINKSTFYPAKMLNELVQNSSERLISKGLKVVLDIENEDTAIFSDHGLLYRIIENLLTNAIRFSPEDKKIYINSGINESGLVIKVRDEGPGFTKEDMERVFTRYARLSALPKGDEYSTGLGLSIVKRLTRMLGGSVELESTYGSGSCFSINLGLI